MWVTTAVGRNCSLTSLKMAETLNNRQKKKNFGVRETEALLSKWGSDEMQRKFQEAYKHNIVWNEIASELRLFERSPSELRTRVSNLKKEYFKLKRNLKPGNPFPDWPYWKLMHSILGRRSVLNKKYTMDSLDIEIKKEGTSEISDKMNIENSLEIEIEGQDSNFSRFCIEGRELESPLPSDSLSVLSEPAFSAASASSDEETQKSNIQNKKTKKRKIAEKDAIQELLEAEKRSYELQWKKLQIEIEVAKSMKTFFSSMANMMDRILKPQSSAQPSMQPFSQSPQNSNWQTPPVNFYPIPFMPNYSQAMPFQPFYSPFLYNNQNNSQKNDSNSTVVNNVSNERNEENRTS